MSSGCESWAAKRSGMRGVYYNILDATGLAAPGGPAAGVAEGGGLEPPRAVRPGSFQGSCLTS